MSLEDKTLESFKTILYLQLAYQMATPLKTRTCKFLSGWKMHFMSQRKEYMAIIATQSGKLES